MTREHLPRWLLAVLCAAALVVWAPFAPWAILGTWLGLYARKLYVPLCHKLGGRSGLSAGLTVSLLLVLLLPIAALMASIAIDAIALVRGLVDSDRGRLVLERLAQGDGSGAAQQPMMSVAGITDLLLSQGARAWTITQQLAGAAAQVLVGLFIMVSGMYGVLTEGPAWWEFAERHAPMPPSSLRRFADAFVETGRGLAFGIVGAGTLQAILATIAYFVLGVPSALALGMLTLLLSVIPAVGTALVWGPVAIGLALTGRTGAAIVLAIVGVAVIGTVRRKWRPNSRSPRSTQTISR